MKMITSLRDKSYQERLVTLSLFPLERRQLEGKSNECFPLLKGFTNANASKLFSVENSSWTSSDCKIKIRIQLIRTKLIFAYDLGTDPNKLPLSSVLCETMHLGRIISTTVSSNKESDNRCI